MSSIDIPRLAKDLPDWYRRYSWEGPYHRKRGYAADSYDNGFPWMTALEDRLSLKAKNGHGLDIDDLVEIAEWGGGQHGIAAQLRRHNTNEGIRNATVRAAARLDSPAEALRELREAISHWGLTYASKTLMFMCPQDYVALDLRLREGLSGLLPSIQDGRGPRAIRSQIKGYVKFIEICQDLRDRVQSPGPRKGKWFLMDIETALFQFVSDNHHF